jgi:hypothetical protein
MKARHAAKGTQWQEAVPQPDSHLAGTKQPDMMRQMRTPSQALTHAQHILGCEPAVSAVV